MQSQMRMSGLSASTATRVIEATYFAGLRKAGVPDE